MKKILTIFQLVLFYTVKADDCVTLDQCPSLLALFENQNDLLEISRSEVVQYLRELQCGSDGLNSLFFCPMIHRDNPIVTKGAGIVGFVQRQDLCSGSLMVIHSSFDPSPLARMRSSKANRFTREKYFSILRNNRRVLHVESHGTCCWSFFSRPHFSGENFSIGIGFSGVPHFNPRSLKKVSCADI